MFFFRCRRCDVSRFQISISRADRHSAIDKTNHFHSVWLTDSREGTIMLDSMKESWRWDFQKSVLSELTTRWSETSLKAANTAEYLKPNLSWKAESTRRVGLAKRNSPSSTTCHWILLVLSVKSVISYEQGSKTRLVDVSADFCFGVWISSSVSAAIIKFLLSNRGKGCFRADKGIYCNFMYSFSFNIVCSFKRMVEELRRELDLTASSTTLSPNFRVPWYLQ